MHEHKIISAILQSREAYVNVSEWIDEKDFTAKGWVLVKGAADYYKHDPSAARVDREILLGRIARKLPNAKAAEGFSEIVDKLPTDIGASNVAAELLVLKRDASADRLAAALGARSGVDEDRKALLLAEYTALQEAASLESSTPLDVYAPGITKLFTDILSDANRIKVHPQRLNERIDGGVLPGHCIIVFGRVEMGKSTAAINMTGGFLSQGKKVLYLENEDPLADTSRRITQRVVRKSRQWIQANVAEAETIAAKRHIDLLTVADCPTSVREIDRAVAANEPDVVVINQMRNLAHGDNAVQQLDTLAWELRNVGKRHQCVTVLITAAKEGEVTKEGTIRPKPVLEVGDVYSSKTGIPGAADLLLGWGCTDQLKANNMACISILKNKIVDGNMTADGKHRKYGHFYVKVNPETNFIYHEDAA
jgi:KaiC/GvpD/RAD55 family RecA-like ATPase